METPPLSSFPPQEGQPVLFFYGRRERLFLVALFSLALLSSFTLGLHYGKRVRSTLEASRSIVSVDEVSHQVTGAPEQFPSKQDLVEQSMGLAQAMDEVLDRLLKEEVKKTGIALEVPRAVDLPTQLK